MLFGTAAQPARCGAWPIVGTNEVRRAYPATRRAPLPDTPVALCSGIPIAVALGTTGSEAGFETSDGFPSPGPVGRLKPLGRSFLAEPASPVLPHGAALSMASRWRRGKGTRSVVLDRAMDDAARTFLAEAFSRPRSAVAHRALRCWPSSSSTSSASIPRWSFTVASRPWGPYPRGHGLGTRRPASSASKPTLTPARKAPLVDLHRTGPKGPSDLAELFSVGRSNRWLQPTAGRGPRAASVAGCDHVPVSLAGPAGSSRTRPSCNDPSRERIRLTAGVARHADHRQSNKWKSQCRQCRCVLASRSGLPVSVIYASSSVSRDAGVLLEEVVHVAPSAPF